MAKYQIKDNQTGKTVTVQGDHAPTEQDAQEIFQKAGLRGGTSNSPQPSQQSSNQGGDPFKTQTAGFLRNIGLGALADIPADVTDAGNALTKGQAAFDNGYQNPYRNEEQLTQTRNQQDPLGFLKNQAGNTAGLMSYAINPGANTLTKAPIIGGAVSQLPGILPKTLDLATTGAIMSGLNESGRPNASLESIKNSAEAGAVINPALYGAGKFITDILPRALGMRAFGSAGSKLPEVIKAQDASGGQSLKEVRNAILDESKQPIDKADIKSMIEDLSQQDEWIGTPGVDSAKKTINKLLNSTPDRLDFYNSVRNNAYSGPFNNSTRADGFMKAASGKIRQYVIDHSTDPALTKNAFDLYAAETAINVAKKGSQGATSEAGRLLNSVGGPEVGIAGALAAIPQLRFLSIPLVLDSILKRPAVATTAAKGLMSLGDNAINPILQKAGVFAAGRAFSGNQPK